MEVTRWGRACAKVPRRTRGLGKNVPDETEYLSRGHIRHSLVFNCFKAAGFALKLRESLKYKTHEDSGLFICLIHLNIPNTNNSTWQIVGAQ